MAMLGPEDQYFVYETRLASFQAPQPVTKRRVSGAHSRAPKTLTWPHKSISPVDLAKAGFYFHPLPSNPDNVVCFLCSKSIDGWEEDDDPLLEHLKHSPGCGWAVLAAIEAEVGDYGKMHPLDPAMVEARKATFAGRWPYESKKGFKCKTKQLVEAGWKYTPTLESDDMTTCAYCQLALDGWESGDKPIDEHQKRSPDCPFFVLLSQLPAPKKGRATKAARASKASRLSIQSVATAMSDFHSVADVTADHEDSIMTTVSTATQGGRKPTRGKKGAATTKGRKTRAKKEDAVEVLEDETVTEAQQPPPPSPPRPAPAPPKSTRGRKRPSDAVEDSVVTNAEAPAPKKRATRGRVSTAENTSVLTATAHDEDMVDAAAAAQPAKRPAAARKKGARASNNTRRTTATRKASGTSLRSQASTASLRAHFDDHGVDDDDDEEIDRQLQADLERPLGDGDEDVAADSDAERRRASPPAAASKAKGRKAGASSRKNATREDVVPAMGYAMFDPAPAQPEDADVDAELEALQAEMNAGDEADVLHVPKKGRKAGTRKASKQTKKMKEAAPPPPSPSPPPQAPDEPTDEVDVLVAPIPAAAPLPISKRDLVAEAADESSGTVVAKTAGSRASNGKRGPGRPPKKWTTSEAAKGNGRPASAALPASEEPASLSSDSFHSPERATAQEPSYTPTGPVPGAQASKPLPPPPPPHSIQRKPLAAPATPRAHHHVSSTPSAKQATISPSPSPQSSDAENQPPSSKAAKAAAATAAATATATATAAAPMNLAKRVAVALEPPAAATTPMRSSPSRRNAVAGLRSTVPWTAADLEAVFFASSPGRDVDGKRAGDKENDGTIVERLLAARGSELSTAERDMTVEEWIYHNAGLAERKLRFECEAMVSAFEREGTRAMGVLEGLIVD